MSLRISRRRSSRESGPGRPPASAWTPIRGCRFKGHVESLQRGTGSVFALLPPENATGNFVKVVQRVPVKIVFDDLGEATKWISPGMSVEAQVTDCEVVR